MKLILFVSLLFISLTGCDKETTKIQEQESQKIQYVVENISEVRVSKGENQRFTNELDINTVIQALNGATLMPGKLDVAPSHLTLELVNKNGSLETISLWLEKKDAKAMIMFASDTHTGYELLKADQEALWNLIYGS